MRIHSLPVPVLFENIHHLHRDCYSTGVQELITALSSSGVATDATNGTDATRGNVEDAQLRKYINALVADVSEAQVEEVDVDCPLFCCRQSLKVLFQGCFCPPTLL